MVSTNTIDGKTYYTFNKQQSNSGVNVTATQRLRKSSGVYYLKMENIVYPAQGGMPGSTTDGYETIILKDYLAVGESWEDSYSQNTTYSDPMYPVITLDVNTVGTIMERNSSITVGGKKYTDVIKVKYVQNVINYGQTSTTTTYYWYSKNIGPVKISSDLGGGQTSVQELSSYVVKK